MDRLDELEVLVETEVYGTIVVEVAAFLALIRCVRAADAMRHEEDQSVRNYDKARAALGAKQEVKHG